MKKLIDFDSLLREDRELEEEADPSYLKQLHHILGDVGEGIDNMKEDLSAVLWLLEQKEIGDDARTSFKPRIDSVIHQLSNLDDVKEELDSISNDVGGYLN